MDNILIGDGTGTAASLLLEQRLDPPRVYGGALVIHVTTIFNKLQLVIFTNSSKALI